MSTAPVAFQAPAKRSNKLRWTISVFAFLGVIGTQGLGPRMLAFLVLLACWADPVVLRIRKQRYFNSADFKARKAAIAAVVAEHNELAAYIGEIRQRGSFSVGQSSTGQYAHLAQTQNTSRHNYKRDRNVAHLQAPNVHNCSLQVVRNASADPIKYVMKYFNIRADEDTLAQVEQMGSSIASLEQAVANLHAREAAITQQVDPPKFVQKHFMAEFLAQVGASFSPITVPYPSYVFEYTSAGGNSSQQAGVTLNTPTIDALVQTMSERIRFRKTAAGQRALMTASLRNRMKQRDNHTCRQCGISIHQEPHLLLEVDHVLPVSRGGLTTEENLQTLCWKCNRTKSNKIYA